MKYFKYGNSGGIDKVRNREINYNSGYYESLHELLKSLTHGTSYAMSGFRIIRYAFDERLDKDVYMVLHDIGEYKEQFVCYFIEDDPRVNK